MSILEQVAARSALIPGLGVDINLHEVRGCLSDAQYGLLLSVFGQNFSERIISDGPVVQDLGLSSLALPEDSNFMHNIANVFESARAGSGMCGLSAVYSIEVGLVELLLGLADDLDRDHGNSLMLATGKGLRVHYEMMESANTNSSVENMDIEETLAMGSRWSFETLEVLDMTSEHLRAKPFLSVTPKAQATAASTTSASGSAARSQKIEYSKDISQEHGAFVLRLFKTRTFHSLIELEFREVETVVDAGLFMKLLAWIGRGGQISSANIQEQVGEFQYNVARPGALWVRTRLPSATINLVTCFEVPDPDRVVLGGFVDVSYAVFCAENTLSVDIKDFTLTSQSSQRQISNAKMQIVTPCVLSYSQVWYTRKGAVADSRQPQLFASAKDFNAMVTYEDVLLSRRIASNITKSLNNVDHTPAPQPFSEAKQEVSKHRMEQDDQDNFPKDLGVQQQQTTTASAGGVTPKMKFQRAALALHSRPILRREGTVGLIDFKSQGKIPEEDVKASTDGKPNLIYRVFGNSIRLTLVDDFNGRWIPLVRLNIPHVMVSGTAGDVTSKLRLSVDLFHQPTSKWKEAVEPWEVEIRYGVKGKEITLHIDAQEEICTIHLSDTSIESLRLALQSWTQDRRAFAILKGSDSAQGAVDNCDHKTTPTSLTPIFVPYTIRNLLAEGLICILADGMEYRIEPQQALELTYEQVWRRKGALHSFARDANEQGMSNFVCLQLVGSKHAFSRVSLEIEEATSYEIEPADLSGHGTPFPLHIVCDLSRRDGQKILSVSSMVTIKNGSELPLMSAILSPDKTLQQIGIIPSQGALAVPLYQSRDGILLIRPVVEDLDYKWCDEKTEGIALDQIHDGSVRITQVIDMKFQRLFGAALSPDTTLLASYACANDVDGVLRQGVLYVTDNALCHYSNLIGSESKVTIALDDDIQSLRKVNTALVFPNAVEVKTASKTYTFRSLQDRAGAFRSILKVLPNKSVAVRDDDVDDRAKDVFDLEPGDVIIAMYYGMLHDGEGIEGMMDALNGYILLSTHHLLFMTNDFVGKVQMRWADIKTFEKKSLMMVRNNSVLIRDLVQAINIALTKPKIMQMRNNAVLIHGRRGRPVLLSSRKWNRDKVVDEEMTALWKTASAEENGGIADSSRDTINQFGDHGTQCRTMTCNITRAFATRLENDPVDKNLVYSRQKLRARDSLTWTVVLIDAVTKKVASERTVGNPCIIELHPPWVVDNFSSTALEVQFVDQTRSCIVSLEIAAGASEQVFGIDFRREVFVRARMPMVKNKASAWSAAFLIHTDSSRNKLEGLLELVDAAGYLQPVVVEKRRDTTCGFRVTLYNRYWILNLTGMPVILRRTQNSSLDNENVRSLPVGSAIGYDIASGWLNQVRVKGFQWSIPFSIEYLGANTIFQLSALEDQQSETAGVPNQHVSIDVSSSTGAGKFDRTIVITFAPEIIMQNHFREPLVIWQRSTNSASYERNARPTIWLEPGQSLPFYIEGDRNKCRLSVNLAAEDVSGQCAAFAPISTSEPILLKTSDGRVLLAQMQRLSANTGTILVRFQEPAGIIPHKICNDTNLNIAVKQKDSRKNLLLRVRPHETIIMVWPDPLLPKVLELVEIQGSSVPALDGLDSQATSTKVLAYYYKRTNTDAGTAAGTPPRHRCRRCSKPHGAI